MTEIIKYALFSAGSILGIIVVAITVQEFIGFYATAKPKTEKK